MTTPPKETLLKNAKRIVKQGGSCFLVSCHTNECPLVGLNCAYNDQNVKQAQDYINKHKGEEMSGEPSIGLTPNDTQVGGSHYTDM